MGTTGTTGSNGREPLGCVGVVWLLLASCVGIAEEGVVGWVDPTSEGG